MTKPRVVAGVLAAWAAVVILALASLGVSHTAAMPGPSADVRFAQAARALVGGRGPTYVHVIDPACSCTAGLLAHLEARRAFAGVTEWVIYLGEDAALQRRLETAGFRFAGSTRETIGETLGLEVAPVLVAITAVDSLAYLGGYFDRPAAVEARDAQIHAALQAARRAEPLPVFGCAVSDRLRAQVDPLGIVYRD